MQFDFLKYFLGMFCFILFGCDHPNDASINVFAGLEKDTNIKYAKRFAVSGNKEVTVIYLFGNRSDFDTTATYIIYKDSTDLKTISGNITYIKSPCKKIAALSSIYANMFCALGELNQLIAIDNVDYINDPEIIARVKSENIKELIKGPEIDLEQTIALAPDIIFTFGMGDPKNDAHQKLLQTQIPFAVSLDHLEETPLARAEWIKFFAAFVNKKETADSIFNIVEKKYIQLMSLAKTAQTKPTVFNEIKFSDAWYMPGGKSYVAKLLEDAGANYVWKNDSSYGSIPLSFEQVFAKAKDADFWLNLSTLKTKKELISFDSRYSEFKAYKTGNLFNNTKTTNAKGYSNYWETGMIYPDRILNDLILIFHPELKEQLKTDLNYYEQLN